MVVSNAGLRKRLASDARWRSFPAHPVADAYTAAQEAAVNCRWALPMQGRFGSTFSAPHFRSNRTCSTRLAVLVRCSDLAMGT